MLKNWPRSRSRSRSWTWLEKAMRHISWSASSSWPQLRCFHSLRLSLQKNIAEKPVVTFYVMKWPCGYDNGSLVAFFLFRVSVLPVSRCLRAFIIIFVQNRRFSILFHWLMMERSQNWPNLRSLISKFWVIHFIDTYLYQSLKVSRQSFGRCSFDEHSNVYEVRSLEVT